MSNVVIDTDPAGNRKITKGRTIKKVDPVVALAMAIGLSEKLRVEGPPDFEFSLETL
jgi:phage terminase large subunit-like protein